MKNTLLAFILLAMPLQTMAGFEKYTYDCKSDARYYLGDGNIHHQFVPVGKLGYPAGTLNGLIWFEHQIDGVTYYFMAQAGVDSYQEDTRERFTIDFFRLNAKGDFNYVDYAAVDFLDLNNLPVTTGLRLANGVKLTNGGWANFTLRCELVPNTNP